MKPFLHAINSSRKFGGKPEDYIRIHNFFDETKAHHADMRHRSILHNSFGIFLAERLYGVPEDKFQELVDMFGWTEKEQKAILELLDFARSGASTNIVNSDGQKVSVRDVGEQHVLEDIGKIPSISDYLKGMPLYEWLGGPRRTVKKIPFKNVD